MIRLQQSLFSYNTFGIKTTAAAFCEVEDLHTLTNSLRYAYEQQIPIYVLGGGSNILFTKPYYNMLFLQNAFKGIEIVEETNENVLLSIGGGESWHNFVQWAVAKNWGGVENLALIPGSVGAAPIQNIGAYGVELSDVFVKLEAFDMNNFSMEIFDKKDCTFGYRHSIFKTATHRGRFFITKVFLSLQKNPIINTKYGDIQKVLQSLNITKPMPYDISKIVIQIRQSKLPDPLLLGNAGSFFKNPTITNHQFEGLKTRFPTMIGYPTEGGVKVAAGWLIEQTGWKGRRINNAGCHEKQALVLVNYGEATGTAILAIAKAIQVDVLNKFDISLETEVNIL